MSIDAEQLLEDASKTGIMDYSKWPEILKHILPVLDHIVYNDFPTPRIPITAPLTTPGFARNGATSPEDTTTPTRSPKVIPATPQPSVNPTTGVTAGANATPDHATASPSVVPNSQPVPAPDALSSSNTTGPAGASVEPPSGALPPPVLALYRSILSMFSGPFSQIPPYTIQRLSELILHPRSHYQTLPAYLRALDKILSVASTADVYPLPIPPDSNAGDSGSYLSQANGAGVSSGAHARDDAFNGAELTRIPWIRESAEGEGEIDAPGEREDGVTVGGGPDGPDRMLLSHAAEQRARERRVSPNATGGANDSADKETTHTTTVTVNGHGPGSVASGGTGAAGVPADTVAMQRGATEREAAVATETRDEDMATARGPHEIGNEDIGPQRGEGRGMPGIVDLEAAVGRPGEGEVVPGSGVQVPEERRAASEERKEAEEEDMEMAGVEVGGDDKKEE